MDKGSSALYEKIDKIITESMIYVERMIARHRTNMYEWSNQLAQSIHAIRYWKLRLKWISMFNHQAAGLPD